MGRGAPIAGDPVVDNGRVLAHPLGISGRAYGVHFQSKPATYGLAS